jgi:hypothetical protein
MAVGALIVSLPMAMDAEAAVHRPNANCLCNLLNLNLVSPYCVDHHPCALPMSQMSSSAVFSGLPMIPPLEEARHHQSRRSLPLHGQNLSEPQLSLGQSFCRKAREISSVQMH